MYSYSLKKLYIEHEKLIKFFNNIPLNDDKINGNTWGDVYPKEHDRFQLIEYLIKEIKDML